MSLIRTPCLSLYPNSQQFQIPEREHERAAEVSAPPSYWRGTALPSGASPLRGRRRAGCSPPSARDEGTCHRAWVPRPPQPDRKLQVLIFQKDPVCYLKKAFLLVQDIMEDTMRFKDNTPNANVIVKLQELSLRLKSCFTKDYEEQDKVGVFWSWEHGVRAEGVFGGPMPAHMHRGVFPCPASPCHCHCALTLSFTDSPHAPLLRTCQAGDSARP